MQSQSHRYKIEEFKEEDLPDLYVKYGLASGPHHVDQLIRDIESQAQAQARSHGAPPLP